MNMPKLDFTRRYRAARAPDADMIEVPRSDTAPLMSALRPFDVMKNKSLSSVAKMNNSGVVVGEFERLLPRTDITARIVMQSQTPAARGTTAGTKDTRDFPYKLKAIGFVNAADILHGKGIGNSKIVSQNFELAP